LINDSISGIDQIFIFVSSTLVDISGCFSSRFLVIENILLPPLPVCSPSFAFKNVLNSFGFLATVMTQRNKSVLETRISSGFLNSIYAVKMLILICSLDK